MCSPVITVIVRNNQNISMICTEKYNALIIVMNKDATIQYYVYPQMTYLHSLMTGGRTSYVM